MTYITGNKNTKTELSITYVGGITTNIKIERIIESRSDSMIVEMEDKRMLYINLNQVLNITFKESED